MAKLIMTKGLPASGKSTWAKEQVSHAKGQIKRISKDDLRALLDNGCHSNANEKFILQVRDAIVEQALSKGIDVIVDDTNFAPKHETRLRQLAQAYKAQFEIKDFTDVDVEECIRRDKQRAHPVGAKVIRDMWRKYLTAPVQAPAYNPNLPDCVIIDIDGTAAIIGDRSPYDAANCHVDTPNPAMAYVYDSIIFSRSAELIFMSGRSEEHRLQTVSWLRDHGFDAYTALHMRLSGDNRKDSIVKKELYEQHIQGKYNVRVIFDDRDQVVAMWRSLGLPCFQVQYGDF